MKIGRLVRLFLFAAVFLASGAVAFRNGKPVAIDLLVWQGEVPLVWLLLAAFAAGMGVAALLLTPTLVRTAWRVRRLRQSR
ncbi:MAG: LapA family protein [Hydrogenophilus sp.]|nr:LapA family protein [Hydrogenophilus sp.]